MDKLKIEERKVENKKEKAAECTGKKKNQIIYVLF